MLFQEFMQFFHSVTNGSFQYCYEAIENTFERTENEFYMKYNAYITQRPELYEQYIDLMRDDMIHAGATARELEEVSRRFREFHKMKFGL